MTAPESVPEVRAERMEAGDDERKIGRYFAGCIRVAVSDEDVEAHNQKMRAEGARGTLLAAIQQIHEDICTDPECPDNAGAAAAIDTLSTLAEAVGDPMKGE